MGREQSPYSLGVLPRPSSKKKKKKKKKKEKKERKEQN